MSEALKPKALYVSIIVLFVEYKLVARAGRASFRNDKLSSSSLQKWRAKTKSLGKRRLNRILAASGDQ